MAELDWQSLAKASMHPLQVRILEHAAAAPDERISPNELSQEFGEKLGNMSYHVRALVARGLLKKAGTTQRRGAVEHHYKVAAKAVARTR
jgi:DNA-binding MarR family transcriptional regulator